MKAICIQSIATKGGLKDEFKILNVPKPNPGKQQVRVKVLCTAINIDDIRIAEGRFPVPGHKIKPSIDKPFILGHDFAGIVDAVGEDVKNLKIGDPVYGQADESWAEYCLSEANTTGVRPDSWTPQQAVSYIMGASVAKAAIDKLTDFRGKTGLIIGASGGIGNIAVQYLTQNNAKIWGVCSARNENAVRSLGADKVFDYTKAPFEEQILKNESKVDFVIDFVGGKETERAAYKVLKSKGQFVTAVGPVDFSKDTDVGTWDMIKLAGYLSWRIFFIPSFIRPKYSFATMPVKPNFSIPPLGEEIKALIDSEHAFDQAGIVNAIERVMSHRAAGKVLLNIGDEEK